MIEVDETSVRFNLEADNDSVPVYAEKVIGKVILSNGNQLEIPFILTAFDLIDLVLNCVADRRKCSVPFWETGTFVSIEYIDSDRCLIAFPVGTPEIRTTFNEVLLSAFRLLRYSAKLMGT